MSELNSSRRTREHRWIVLGEDGRFVTVGRHTNPSESEISHAENKLRSAGLAGWLAVMQGSPHAHQVPELLMVRPLASPSCCFEEAAAAFAAQHQIPPD
jgi:hypothetical protein